MFFSVQLYTKCAVLRLFCAVLKTNLYSSEIILCICAENDHCRTRLKCTKMHFRWNKNSKFTLIDASDYSRTNNEKGVHGRH